MPEIVNNLNMRTLPDSGKSTDRNGAVDWEEVRRHFALDDDYVDMRAFAASPIPKGTLDRFVENYEYVQSFPSQRNHGVAHGNKGELRVKIAEQLNASYEEVAIMRNTTEALNNALNGIRLNEGDEVLASVHEYDSMMGTLAQRAHREGIKVTSVDVPYQPTSKEQVVDLFKQSATSKTKVLLISHIVWISGQIYPVEELCEWARANDIITVIDAAQSFSHIETDVSKIGCDYFGASLHKWCTAPLGTGFLYIRKDRIADTYPLLGSYQYAPDSPKIEKFENFGATSPVFDVCVNSLDYWSKLGLDTKRQRILYLKNYLVDKLKAVDKVEITTNLEVENSCGITYFKVAGRSANDIKSRLYEDFNVSVQAIEDYKTMYVDYKGVNCVGVATPVFILPKQIDYFIDSLTKVV